MSAPPPSSPSGGDAAAADASPALPAAKRRREELSGAAASGPPAPSAKAAGLDAEHAAAARFRAGGLRCVAPYPHSYAASAKRRWLGQRLADFYAREYGALDPGYVGAAIDAGAIRVNGGAAPREHPIADGDRLERWLHHHEPRVPGELIALVATTPALHVVAKPAGIPVHASGPYRYNTLLSLLVAEHGLPYEQLNPVHRLDRLTSGLVLLARTKAAAAALGRAMAGRELRKRYVAEVEGEFPAAPPLPPLPPVAAPAADTAGADDEATTLRAIAALAASGGASWLEQDDDGNSGSPFNEGAWPFLRDLSGAAGEIDASRSAGCPFLASFAPPSALATEGLLLAADDAGEGGSRGGDAAASNAPTAATADLASSVGWTSSGWLRVVTGIGGVDIKNCVAGVTPLAAAPSSSSSSAAAAAEPPSPSPAPPAVDSKLSVTLFRRLGVRRVPDAGAPGGLRVTSLVEAAPLTGRTHQIRVHAAWLGCPIVDDPIYCAPARARLAAVDALSAHVRLQDAGKATAPAAAAAAATSAVAPTGASAPAAQHETLADICEEQRDWEAARAASVLSGEGAPGVSSSAAAAEATDTGVSSLPPPPPPPPPGAAGKKGGKAARPQLPPPSLDALVSLCAYCRRGPAAEFNAQQLISRGLRLHSLAYRGPAWAYACAPPPWAAPYWQEQGAGDVGT
jgi:23S rRNA-/tRNA-specific pseudouridylate synthase